MTEDAAKQTAQADTRKILADARPLLDAVERVAQPGLARRWRQIDKRLRDGKPSDRLLQQLIDDISRSIEVVEDRRQAPLKLDYPPELPISEHAAELVAAIKAHQVVIVAGETGSGKTTQLPKMLLQAGFGARGMIGVTQPRRIAARSIASRLAEEMACEGSDRVAFQVRFEDKSSAATRVKLMTDGILLAEAAGDRDLNRYDAIIVDEAHERSLNIDFLLGILKQLLKRRPDLRVIVTSATIDTERLSAFFDAAPVFEVSGRTYPVEVRYLDEEQAAAGHPLDRMVLDAVRRLDRTDPRGDILVFLSGERDIREVADTLHKASLRHTEVLPLYSRLSRAEQNAIFHPGPKRRIVLATNVAETSLTVPRIRFVIDSGLARISRYSHRSKVQRLPIEPISQASANQRSGRCGRLGPGIAERLYAEDDFAQRPEYTEPEIQRTSLASVILRMLTLRLGDIEDFPFVDPPSLPLINDGYQLLRELGAINDRRKLSAIGRRLGRLPLDVRLARVLIECDQRGALEHGLTVVAALSIADPRERPLDKAAAADEAHASFAAADDFATLLKLYATFLEQASQRGSNQLRKWCREHFLSWLRMREWRELRRQLAREMDHSANATISQPDDKQLDHLRRCLLSGLLSHVGLKTEDGDYQGARQRRFVLFPGSVLAARPPKWVMTAQLMETSRTFGLCAAPVRPEWIERAAGDLVKRHYFDPHWSRKAGRVVAFEQVTLFGLVIVERRRVDYGRIDQAAARQEFIRAALVEGDVNLDAPFHEHNQGLRAAIEALEDRQRRRDLLVDDEVLVAFYDERIPQEVCDLPSLKKWLGKNPDGRQLEIDEDALLARSAHGVTIEQFPDTWQIGDATLPLSYRFEPGQPDDGVTLSAPLALLNQVTAGQAGWLVPGMLLDKVTALIKSLPKSRRRLLAPAPDYATAVVESLRFGEGELPAEVARQLQRIKGIAFAADEFDEAALPDHLRMNFRLLDDAGKVVAEGRDLHALQARHGNRAARKLQRAAVSGEAAGPWSEWPDQALPEAMQVHGVDVFPALVDAGDSGVMRQVFETSEDARAAHIEGVARLLSLRLRSDLKRIMRQHAVSNAAALAYAPLASASALADDIAWRALTDLVADEPFCRDQDAFAQITDVTRSRLSQRVHALTELLGQVLERYGPLAAAITDASRRWPVAADDMESQLGFLVYEGFAGEVATGFLEHYPRYFDALDRRLEALRLDAGRDLARQRDVERFWRPCLDLCDVGYPPAVAQLHQLIEEYRVSLFAQPLGTAVKVSAKRLERALAAAQAAI